MDLGWGIGVGDRCAYGEVPGVHDAEIEDRGNISLETFEF